jgi:hypothetical protein
MSRIEALKYEVLNLIPDKDKGAEKLKTTVNKLFETLTDMNALNFEAILPIKHVDMCAQTICWSNREFDTYETPVTFTFEDENGEWQELSSSERDEAIEKYKEMIDELEMKPRMTVKQQKRLNDLDAAKDRLERADSEGPELMWNTSWQPYSDNEVDYDVAERVPQLTWVKSTSGDDEGQSYITLTCIGQDNGPALMAYVVLAHGVVPDQYLKYWTREREWTRHVIGTSCFLECAAKLGVLPQLKEVLKQDEAEKKRARRKAERERLRKDALKKQRPCKEFLDALKRHHDAGEDSPVYRLSQLFNEFGGPEAVLNKTAVMKDYQRVLTAFEHGVWIRDILKYYDVIKEKE